MILVRDTRRSLKRSPRCRMKRQLTREIVALEGEGRPSFNVLQNGASKATVIYYVFDLMQGCNRRDPRIPSRAARKEGSTEAFRTDPVFTGTAGQHLRPGAIGQSAAIGRARCQATGQPLRCTASKERGGTQEEPAPKLLPSPQWKTGPNRRPSANGFATSSWP